MSKHKWTFDPDYCVVEDANGEPICHVQEHGSLNTVARTGQLCSHADGFLIAAAPGMRDRIAILERERAEMLEMLKGAVKVGCPGCYALAGQECNDGCKWAALIAKAEGRDA